MDSIEGLRMSIGNILNNTLAKYNLGSPLMTMIISSLVIMIFNSFLEKIINLSNIWKKSIFFNVNELFSTRNEIELEGSILINRFSRVNNFSDRFMTVIDWVIKNTHKIENIKKLKEEEMKKNNNDNSYEDTEMNFILNHNNFLRIDKENDIWVKFNVQDEEEKGENNKKTNSVKKINIIISSKKLSVDYLKKFIDNKTQKYIQEINENNMNKTFYFEYVKEDEECNRTKFSQVEFVTNRKLKNVFFDQKEVFMKKFNFFMNNRDWYDDHGIPYHLGILLYGFPGCGKTSLIKAIAKETGYQIISIPLGRIKKAEDLNNIFYTERINGNKIPMSKRIYLFEDIDAMNVSLKRDNNTLDNSSNTDELSEDKNKSDKKDNDTTLLTKLIKAESNKINNNLKDDDPLTLSHLLNIIDGMIEMPGRIIILTTNYIDKLDPALIREGRIDIKVEMKKASIKIINQMFYWFYKEELKEDILKKIPDRHFTPAKISNIFYKNYDDSKKAINDLITFYYKLHLFSKNLSQLQLLLYSFLNLL